MEQDDAYGPLQFQNAPTQCGLLDTKHTGCSVEATMVRSGNGVTKLLDIEVQVANLLSELNTKL